MVRVSSSEGLVVGVLHHDCELRLAAILGDHIHSTRLPPLDGNVVLVAKPTMCDRHWDLFADLDDGAHFDASLGELARIRLDLGMVIAELLSHELLQGSSIKHDLL